MIETFSLPLLHPPVVLPPGVIVAVDVPEFERVPPTHLSVLSAFYGQIAEIPSGLIIFVPDVYRAQLTRKTEE